MFMLSLELVNIAVFFVIFKSENPFINLLVYFGMVGVFYHYNYEKQLFSGSIYGQISIRKEVLL